MRKGGLAQRATSALIAIPPVMLLIWADDYRLLFALFVAALVAVGLYEYYAIVRAKAISPETIGGIVAGTLVAFLGVFHSLTLVSLALYGGCLLVATLHIVRGQHSVAGLASSLFGIFYVGWLGAHFTLLQSEPRFGPGLVTILLLAVSVTDAFAYLGGRAFGRTKLAPLVSPNKTREGAVSGLLFAIIAMLILWMIRRQGWGSALPDWSLARYLGTGALLSVVGQIGDLAESCLKRSAGVKDSGNILPGHGGVLDRCDGMLFAAPVLYYMIASPF